ncbi:MULTISPECIES: DNA adenine methylase [Clostridium]|uniref:Site-specific DNA-methyltransferase (adenine-specific) n=2 Tax=Clostridium TaxID=1485 RepID=A0A151AKB3_9CLOT|nr:Dam family site-specific DNA-(adenine-N6)-methyltransferase [Clostridium thermopalmarium]KYH28099.1 modification methylase DpnIIA [Clostridium colicanis DSM 13634]MBE6043046.1 Dam family site-specific DNA-(adenine-N6)-methyltransferase [Clostridium thermopalmarium]
MTNNAKPFLKWAGGKTQLLSQFEEYYPIELKENKIKTYVEPFLGGGAVFFSLQSKENCNFENIILNDINKELIITYKVIQQKVDELIECLSDLEQRYLRAEMEEKEKMYYSQREAFNIEKTSIDYNNYSDDWIQHAAKMIFLNKTCFNGLYRENKKGGFNVPFGKRKNVTICDESNLREVNKALTGVILTCGDFEEITNDYEIKNLIGKDTFVYIDPPYRPLNATSNFNDYSKEPFNDKSQIRLINWTKKLHDRGSLFMYSNSDPTNIQEKDDFFEVEFEKAFHGDRSIKINRVQASRVINSKGTGRGKIRELLITNYEVNTSKRAVGIID